MLAVALIAPAIVCNWLVGPSRLLVGLFFIGLVCGLVSMLMLLIELFLARRRFRMELRELDELAGQDMNAKP